MIKEDSLGVTNEADNLLFQNSKMEQEAGSTKNKEEKNRKYLIG